MKKEPLLNPLKGYFHWVLLHLADLNYVEIISHTHLAKERGQRGGRNKRNFSKESKS